MQSYLAFSEQADVKQDNDERKAAERIARDERIAGQKASAARWKERTGPKPSPDRGKIKSGLDRILGRKKEGVWKP
jgi:hypothetical protein